MAETLVLPSADQYIETEDEKMMRLEIFGKPPPVMARFYTGAERDGINSTPECPIYIDKTMVFLQVVGDRDSQTALATQDHVNRFPREWALFEKNKDNHPIPLTALPKMTPAILEAFRELKVNSLDDVLTATLPEYLEKYRKWAQWIKAVHDNADGKKARVPL